MSLFGLSLFIGKNSDYQPRWSLVVVVMVNTHTHCLTSLSIVLNIVVSVGAVDLLQDLLLLHVVLPDGRDSRTWHCCIADQISRRALIIIRV